MNLGRDTDFQTGTDARWVSGSGFTWMRIITLLWVGCFVGCTGSRGAILEWDGKLDSVRPQVIVTLPATATPSVTGVSTGTALTATFTKDMAPATLHPTSFTVTGPGMTVVAGSVTYTSRVATFTPTFALAGQTTYTATITIAATDTSNNALAGNQAPLPGPSSYIWQFTTGLAPVTTRLNTGLVEAFGHNRQVSPDGSIQNATIAGESVPAQKSLSPSGTYQLRHGFLPPPPR